MSLSEFDIIALGSENIFFLFSFGILLYIFIIFTNKFWDLKIEMTDMVREFALLNSKQRILKGSIVFVITVYNRWESIKTVLKDLMRRGYNNIVVVNDGSSDNTLNALTTLEHTNNDLIVLNHFKNRGQWAALETGFEYIRRFWNVDYVVTYDSDGQHDIWDLQKFITPLDTDSEIDIVLGSRFIDGAVTNASWVKQFVLKAGVVFTTLISSWKFSDTHNGYRAMRKEVLFDLHLTMDEAPHASEILNIISKKKLRFSEVPVSIVYSDQMVKKWLQWWSLPWMVIRIIWDKLFR